jgi:TrmH family RNA methyltransferase
VITSNQNALYKKCKQLFLKKYRDQYQQFLIYGEHLIQKALATGLIETIITSDETLEGVLFSETLVRDLNQSVTAFKRLAICNKPQILSSSPLSTKILALDNIQDPDNLGALIRSASAFGFDTIYLNSQSCDIYNEKAIRATQGSLFDVDIIRCDLVNKLTELKTLGYQVLIAMPQDSEQVNEQVKQVLVLGNEGSGVSVEIIKLADAQVTIKTQNVESLNVSVAGAILMYERKLIK